MLEGTASAGELAAFSLPSSPRQQQRSGPGSWFNPASAASSRPITPRGGIGLRTTLTAAAALSNLSRLSRAASAATHHQQQQQPLSGAASLEPSPSACLPPPLWQDVAPNAAEPKTAPVAQQLSSQDRALLPPEAAGVPDGQHAVGPTCQSSSSAQEQKQLWQPSSQELPAVDSGAHVRSSLRCSSTVSLNLWQPSMAAAGGAEAAADAGSRPGNSGISAPAGPATVGNSEAAPAVASSDPSSSQVQHSLRITIGTGPSSTLTPRLSSLSSLGPAASLSPGASLQVTPRQQSLLSPGVQLSPRQDSLRGMASRGLGSGRRRLEEAAAAAGAAPVSCDRLSLGSHNDSFNSEEGFGSPVKQRCECSWSPVCGSRRCPAAARHLHPLMPWAFP
jgi:hypothetical protein